jgi:hypothetical protein
MPAWYSRERGRAGPAARALLIGLIAALVWLPATVSAASTTACLVWAKGTHVNYHTLQAALDATPAGVTLLVRGTCVGASVVSKNVTIVAGSNREFDRATLDGANAGSVLTVAAGITLRIEGLVITHGFFQFPNPGGGGIFNEGTLVVKGSTLIDNNAQQGGGILNYGVATVTGSTLDHNGIYEGGNIYNRGTLVVKDSTLVRGAGRFGQGLFNAPGGTATLIRSSVTDNDAAIPFSGGGIENDGDLTLIDSDVSHNVSVFGGGILNQGTARLIGSTVTDNVATIGGGIHIGPAFFPGTGTEQVDLIDTRVDGNTAQYGGGIYNKGVVTLTGRARIGGNSAAAIGQGGGMFNDPGTSVVGITRMTFRPPNTPDQCVGCGP